MPGELGSGAGGGSGRRASGGTQRLTWFEWYEAKVKPQRAVTPADGESVKELTPLEYVRACIRLDEAETAGDKRPTLVYFHWPHEHPVYGEQAKDICGKTLEDETTARWGLLYRCVQVDMGASDARLVQLLGAEGKPSIVVLDAQAAVLARLDTASPSKLQKGLKDTLLKLPERWKSVLKETADQAKKIAEAKKLAKADEYENALALVRDVVRSNVRIGEAFDDASCLLPDLEERLARQKAKEDAKKGK